MFNSSSRRRRVRWSRALLVVALGAAGCVGSDVGAAGGEDTQDLEALDPATLHWVAPLGDDVIAADDPVDLTVYTQNAVATVVHFTVDGVEVGACDAGDPAQDCNEGDSWSFATSFDTAGRHAIGAYFVDAAGTHVETSRELDVVTDDADSASATLDPSPADDSTDPTATASLIEEGTGQVAQGITAARGYLDPDQPIGWAGCHAGARQRTTAHSERGTCAPPTGSHAACVQWGVQNGRVVLARGRIDGSTSHIDRCIQRYYPSIQRYTDLDYVSRASVAAWLATTSNCEPRPAWHANLMSASRCVATARSRRGGHQHLTGAACVARMHGNPDFALQLAVAFVQSQVRRHGNDPPLLAGVLDRGLHPQAAGHNQWCVGSGRGSDRFVSNFVAAYNAYRTWEDRAAPGSLAGAVRTSAIRIGAAPAPSLDCDALLNGPAQPTSVDWRECSTLVTHYSRIGTTAFFWDHTQTCVLPAYRACAPTAAVCTSTDAAGHATYDFDWSTPDAVIARAARPGWGATVQANTLLYPSIPGGMKCELDALAPGARGARLQALMETYVGAAVARYAGRGVEWTLFNEVASSDFVSNTSTQGSFTMHFDPARDFLRYMSPDQFAGAMASVYGVADRADPNALLMINEHTAEGMSARAQNYRTLIAYLLSRGVPLHSIGMQGHLSSNPDNSGYFAPASITDNFDAISRLHLDPATGRAWPHLHPSVVAQDGLRMQLTELGIRQTGEPEAVQRRYLYDVAAACAAQPHCDAMTFWSVGDHDDWDNTYFCAAPGTTCDAAALFDTNYCPKDLVPTLTEAIARHAYPANAAAPACM